MPYNSLGGIPVLEAQKRNIPVFAVKENKTVLDVTKDNLHVNCRLINTYHELVDII